MHTHTRTQTHTHTGFSLSPSAGAHRILTTTPKGTSESTSRAANVPEFSASVSLSPAEVLTEGAHWPSGLQRSKRRSWGCSRGVGRAPSPDASAQVCDGCGARGRRPGAPPATGYGSWPELRQPSQLLLGLFASLNQSACWGQPQYPACRLVLDSAGAEGSGGGSQTAALRRSWPSLSVARGVLRHLPRPEPAKGTWGDGPEGSTAFGPHRLSTSCRTQRG